MDCLHLQIPPLPHFITIGHSIWEPNAIHFERSFGVYDLLIVNKGMLYMLENGIPYEIGPGQLLLLEPGLLHVGHRPCVEKTEIYWVHFSHLHPPITADKDQIPWGTLLQKGTDFDLSPTKQSIFLPKFMKVDLQPLIPLLDSMVEIQSKLCTDNALRLHSYFYELLTELQKLLTHTVAESRSLAISLRVEQYLQKHAYSPLITAEIERELHFHIDYLARCLRKHTGMSPLQYQQFLRLSEAKRLLASTQHPVPLISEQVGFSDYNYFIRLFRSKVGVTPGAYRNSAHRYA